MSKAIRQELSSLLAATEELLNCPEPKLEAWEEYSRGRNELFSRLQLLPVSGGAPENSSVEIRDLMARILEKDRLLVRKIRHHLSNFSQELVSLAEARRVFKAYASNANSAFSMARVTA